ncbi:MAG: sigma-70 family RNA polymerase sigma factor [Prevotellaceae bacterium]|jgi:RNA polymerase sigma factor (sigma-70 family)|nr:sigma-70 family RNA polymerase sigma factor [Prevotellaceae bacterium]
MNLHDALWKRIALGEIDAFEEMYRQYCQPLFVYGLKLCSDRNLVKDVIHETFIELWINRTRFDIRQPAQYLRTIVRRRILKQVSQRQTQSIEFTEFPCPSYEDLLILSQTEEENREKVRQALKKLTPRQLEIIRLKFFENKNYEEIATILSASPRTIYNQVYEALKTLRKVINAILFWI